MAHPDYVRARIHALEERLARLRAEKDRLLARANVSDRKRATRRKIVIGGTVLAALERDGVPQLRTEAELRRWLEGQLTRPHDRAVFDLAPSKST
jgi:hypothetical protein